MKTKIFTPVVFGNTAWLQFSNLKFGPLNTHPSDMTNEYKRVECN